MFPSGIPESLTVAMVQAELGWTERQVLEDNTVAGLRRLMMVIGAKNKAEAAESRRLESKARRRK